MAQAAAVPAEARIIGSGYRSMRAGGPIARCFWVASRHEAGKEYSVYAMASGHLACTCPASHFRGACAHRAAVERALAEEAAATRAAEDQAAHELTRYGITRKGLAYLERWRREQAEQAGMGTTKQGTREQAPSGARGQDGQGVLNRTQPFSLLKR